ncbi:hypothetical protein MBLNU457_3469t1 [Dothideomycetes sp. NU457]
MPPIPVYSDAPIVASKAQGVTPSTQEQPTSTSTAPTTTTSSNNANVPSYPSAQPGSAAFPGPTPAAQRSQPPPPTRTMPLDDQASASPPAPQPGAVPVAPTATASATSSMYTPANPLSAPSQMAIPPPQPSNLSTRSTIPTTTPQNRNLPTSLPLGDAPSVPSQQSQYSTHMPAPQVSPPEPPMGYRQDPYASELSAQQRASLDVMEAEERRGSIGGYLAGITGTPVKKTGETGSTFGSPGAAGFGDAGQVWDAVKGWAGGVATKAAEIEADVWRRVNGKE